MAWWGADRSLLLALAGSVGGGCLICIARGTAVMTPHGPRAIDTLAIGDEVCSVDPATGELVSTRIVARRRGTRECMAIEVAGRRLLLTPSHPVYDANAATYREAGVLVADRSARVLVVGPHGMSAEPIERVVTLDGSASSDPERDPIFFLFSLGTPEESESTFVNGRLEWFTNSSTAEFTPDVAGTYRAGLIVSDGADDSDPDRVIVFVDESDEPMRSGSGSSTTD